MNPKVSILVPIYGVEKFIERCAISLFEQTFQDIEYIFVNDCTPDDSISILKKTLERYPHRKSQVKIINHHVNSGIAVVRNTLISNSKGEYILFVDSDDYLDLNAIELLYNKAFEENSDIVVCDYFIEYPKSMLPINQNIGISKESFLKSILSIEILAPFWNKLIRRNLYTEHNLRAEEGVNLGEDYMIIPKLVYYAEEISKVNIPLYYYSQLNSESYTNQKLSRKNIENIIFVVNDLTSFFNNKKDYYLFKDFLIKGKLRKKMDILFFADKEYLKELNTLFPETNELKDKTFLLSRDKISYRLLKKSYIGLFLIYRNVYKLLFNIKRILTKK